MNFVGSSTCIDTCKNGCFLFKKICFYLFFFWLFFLNISPLAVASANIYSYASTIISVICLSSVALSIYQKRSIFIYNKWLILFLIISTISCFSNFDGFPANVKRVLWSAIYLLFLFSDDDLSSLVKETKDIFSSIVFFLSLVSLGMFFANYENVFPLLDYVVYMGFTDFRLFGAYMDPNYASVLSILCIIFCLENLMKKRYVKFSVLNLIVQIFYMSLANSRTCMVSLFILSFFVSFFSLYNKFKFNKVLNISLSVLSSFFCAFLCLLSLKFSSTIMIKSASLLNSSITCDEFQFDRINIDESLDYSSGRLEIWKSAFEIFKKKWLLGTSPGNIKNYAENYFPDCIIAERHYYAMHNVFIDVFTSVGLIGGLVFLLFLLKFLIRIIKIYIKRINENGEYNLDLDVLVSSVLAISISSMFLSDIMFFNKLSAFFFWLFLGEIRRKMEIL